MDLTDGTFTKHERDCMTDTHIFVHRGGTRPPHEGPCSTAPLATWLYMANPTVSLTVLIAGWAGDQD